MANLTATLDALKDEFTALHTAKEDRFWAAKMGLSPDPVAAQKALSEAEVAANRFLQDPARLASLRALAGQSEGTAAERRVLQGWIALFAANVSSRPRAGACPSRLWRWRASFSRSGARCAWA